MEKENKRERWIKMAKDHKILSVVVILLLLATVFRIGSAIYSNISPNIEKEEPVTVETGVAELRDISSTTPLTGRILPKDEVAIIPLASGKVTGVYVKVGDYVGAGTVLFQIDNSQVVSSYNQAKAAFDLANTTYSNMATLYEAGAVSKSSLDQSYVSFVSARESFNSASEMYANYSVTSPISGYVTSLNVTVGSMAGQTMAASVANTDSLIIDITVSEYLATKIEKGEQVEIKISSLKDKSYTGILSEISPAPAYGTLTYPATIDVIDDSGDIKAGMFAEIMVKDNEAKSALCVPSDAVITKSGENIVVLLDKDNIPKYKKVTTGIDNGEIVEIVSGLKQGDLIVVTGQQYIKEGEAVKISGGDSGLTKDNAKTSDNKGLDKE
ncbi:MAG: efflux RND transporter periplasmic adaptor subunit [Eubacteriales bacterium]|nr:efflux RND transporter periplasmic adaptor subunit [Eubacteriales bacterium]